MSNQIQFDQDDLSSEKGINYSRLRDLLQAQDWESADYETYEVMFRAVDEKTITDFISRDGLSNFPCIDLRTINGLWVKYSQGKFGFSVQKKIWQRCGSPTDYNKGWEKFGVLVGWRRKWVFGTGVSGWLSYSELTFGLNAPKGHFPHIALYGLSQRLVESYTEGCLYSEKAGVVLFSRLATCRL